MNETIKDKGGKELLVKIYQLSYYIKKVSGRKALNLLEKLELLKEIKKVLLEESDHDEDDD
ncbi:hypothetical protein ACFL5G_01190 [Candidatus Margulisiibacteriota bacterium]